MLLNTSTVGLPISRFRSCRSVIFVNRFFHPDHSATSQIVSDLAFSLASSGQRVQVIASNGLYDDPTAKLAAYEKIDGVEIHRVGNIRFGRDSLGGRVLDYLEMYRSFAAALARFAKTGDTVIAKTDPPLLSIWVAAIARAKGLTLINWLQDLYPEIALELGVNFLRPAAGVLTAARNASLRAATLNVVIGEIMAERLIDDGLAPDKVVIIPNWCNDKIIDPIFFANNPLRRDWGLEGKFVVGYSGNLGRAHEYETLLGAAQLLSDRNDIAFLFVGGGHRSGPLKTAIDARHLSKQFEFRPYQSAALLPLSLTMPDAHWLSLTPAMEGLIVPSKFYGILAAGRPTIAVVDSQGEIARSISRHDCGVQITPGDSRALANAIVSMVETPARVAEMGGNARHLLETTFSRSQSLELWRRTLLRVDAISR